MTTITFPEEKPQTQTGNTSTKNSEFTFRAQSSEPSKPGLDPLTPEESAILEAAKEISLISDAALKKKATNETPETMGWSKDQTELFYSFIKDISLEQEKATLSQKKSALEKSISNGKIPTSLGRLISYYSFNLALISFTAAFALTGIKMEQNPHDPIVSKRMLNGTLDVAVTGTELGVIGTAAGGAVALFGLGNIPKRRRLKRINKEQEDVENKQTDNTIIQRQLQRKIRQDGHS